MSKIDNKTRGKKKYEKKYYVHHAKKMLRTS